MNNFFLLNEAINLDDLNRFKSGMSEMIVIKEEAEDYDNIIKHLSVWNLPIWLQVFADPSQQASAIVKFTEQLELHQTYIFNELIFDTEYPDMSNAFLGIDFSNTKIDLNRQVTNLSLFYKFREETLWNVDFKNFWKKRVFLFPMLVFCGEVQHQVSRLGTSKYFDQIIEKLIVFNSAVNKWERGNFNYRIINQNFALNISEESEQTMRKYGFQRRFQLPSGRTELFELHIKTGDLRFHFYADNSNRTVYVGYIGNHLSTVSN